MKFSLFFFIIVLISCNQNAAPKEEATIPAAPIVKVQPEDSATIIMRNTITPIVTHELEMASVIKSMSIDSISYTMVSLKEFYAVKKEELKKSMKLSTNKEKTEHALGYLDKMQAGAAATPTIYKILFHLNAKLGNNVTYNETHTKYLNKDFKEIQIVFP